MAAARSFSLALSLALLSAGVSRAGGAEQAGATDQAGLSSTYGPLPKPAGSGFLPANRLPDAAALLGPPPTAVSGTAQGDVATFLATRRLQGSERWALATRDAVFGADALLQDFSCALGVELTPKTAPALDHLLSKIVVDSQAVEGPAKKMFKRRRPFVDHEGPICVEEAPWLVKSYSYPSGHSTFSWITALILAEVAPDRATDILARARTYGESRVVCGVHYESDVQAGRLVGSATFSALQAEPSFQKDLAAVRREIAKLRTTGAAKPDAVECRIEADAVAHPVW